MQDTRVWSLGREDPLVKEMATHCSILAWEIPRTEESGRLQSMGSQRDGRDLTTKQQHLSIQLSVCLSVYLSIYLPGNLKAADNDQKQVKTCRGRYAWKMKFNRWDLLFWRSFFFSVHVQISQRLWRQKATVLLAWGFRGQCGSKKKKKNSHKVRKKSWKEETQSNSTPKPAYKIHSNF